MRDAGRNGLLTMNDQSTDIPIVRAPADSDRIEIVCPDCGKGGIWAFPESFQVVIEGTLIVTCSNGHRWGICNG